MPRTGSASRFPGFGKGTTTGDREGDYSSIVFDATDGSYWAANEYQLLTTGDSGDWGTALVNFKFKTGPSVAAYPALFPAATASQDKITPQTIADAALIKYFSARGK